MRRGSLGPTLPRTIPVRVKVGPVRPPVAATARRRRRRRRRRVPPGLRPVASGSHPCAQAIPSVRTSGSESRPCAQVVPSVRASCSDSLPCAERSCPLAQAFPVRARKLSGPTRTPPCSRQFWSVRASVSCAERPTAADFNSFPIRIRILTLNILHIQEDNH
jgi:hypothetical protein